jgi:hypothetical protein
MKPKDPIWNFYEVMEEGSKKITKGRECGTGTRRNLHYVQ